MHDDFPDKALHSESPAATGDHEPGGTRPRTGRDGGFPRPGGRVSLVDEIAGLDLDIMKLLARRAKLVAKLRGGRDHASTPVAVKAEKDVRTAWEKNAARFSRDDKFVRQLFGLIQEARVDTMAQSVSRGVFNLAPAKRPVTVHLTGPADIAATRLVAGMAAACGRPMSLENAVVNTGLVDCLKALNSCGAQFSWTSAGRPGEGVLTHAASSAPLDFSDKVLYLGNDTLTMYLTAFLAVAHTGRVRFTGGSGLKMADLSPLRRFLPQLGARFAHNMPKSNGLPGRMESSGMVPDTITLPGDLPEEGIAALVCAAATWRKKVNLVCSAPPADVLQKALATALPLLRDSGVEECMSGAMLAVDGGDILVPSAPSLPIDSAVAAYFLALPVFTGGSVTLAGAWDAGSPLAGQAADILTHYGATVRAAEDGVRVDMPSGAVVRHDAAHDLSRAAPELLPLGLALSALAAKHARGGVPSPQLPEYADATLVDGFFAYLGFARGDETLRASSGNGEASDAPWTSPGAYWTFAYALAAYLKPGLALTNPATATELLPSFWAIYNALPDPGAAPAKKAEKPDAKRRRIIAK